MCVLCIHCELLLVRNREIHLFSVPFQQILTSSRTLFKINNLMRSVGFTVSVKKILYIGGTKSVKFVEKINFVRKYFPSHLWPKSKQ
jgi:hypothetical protein